MKTVVILACALLICTQHSGAQQGDIPCYTARRADEALRKCRGQDSEEACIIKCQFDEMGMLKPDKTPDADLMARFANTCPDLRAGGWRRNEFLCFTREAAKVTEGTCKGFEPLTSCIPGQ